MSDPTLEERLTTVLGEHTASYDYERWWGCECDLLMSDNRVKQEDHPAHVADALAAVVRDAQAEAWDEGWRVCAGVEGTTEQPTHPNPYRTAEGETP